MSVNARLTDLIAATAPAGGELIYLVQGGNSRQLTLGAIGGALLDDTGQTAARTTLGIAAIVANTMLVDNAAGTARETKTFSQVRDLLTAGKAISPTQYGAVGDGVTDDTVDYAEAEAAATVVYLQPGAVFNLDTGFPTKPVYGPGKLKMDGIEFDGYQMQVDAYRSTIFMTPSDYTDEIGFPSAGYNKGVLLGAGSVLSGVVNRFVGIGAGVLQRAVDIDRFEAIGNGCMQFSKYGNRITALGSANCQWLGADLATVELTHPWWLEDVGGSVPGDTGWDFQGIETRNPGMGAQIAAFSAYATAQGDIANVVAIGRDSIGGNVISNQDTAVGYGSLAGFSTQGNTAVGCDSLNQGVFILQSTAVGYESGRYWQEGTRNVIVGRGAADDVVRGSYNTLLGAFAGANAVTDLDDSVLIGYAAGNTVSGTDLNDIFVLGNRNTPFLITGNFSTGAVGLGVAPADIKSAGVGIHIQGSSFGAVEAASGSLDDLILETSDNTGMTIRSGATSLGQIGFARPGQSSRGVIQYDHSADQFSVNIAGSTRAQFGNGTIIGTGGTFQGAGTLNVIGNIYRAGTQVVTTRQTGWTAATGTATRTTFATSTVTTEVLAQHVKALIDDLITHGLIGA